MKKSLKILLIFLLAILTKLVISYATNEIIIINYNNNIYNSFLIKTLYFLNFNQPYIAYYNEGNIFYKTEKYDKALEKYNKALKKNPPQNKVCDIRINLSLSIIKQVDTSNYKKAYDQLEEAKGNLYNNNCASPTDDSGYSKKAEKLEQEIKNLQDQLNNSNNNNGGDDNNQNNENNEEEENNYSEIEEQLKEIERNSHANRQDDMNTYENMGEYSYYSGKKW